MDSAPELIGCAHNTEIDDANHSCKNFIVESGQNLDTISLKDLIVGKAYFHTSSYLWRNIYSAGEPKEHFYHSAYMGDYFLSMLHAQHGDIGYIDEVMSCYRMTGRGTWTRFSERQRSQINLRCLFMYNKVLKYKYAHEFTRIWWGCDSEMKLLKEEGGNKLDMLRLWLLRGSIDVRSNEYTRVWAEHLVKRREELNGKQSRLSKIIYTVLEAWCLKQTAGNEEELAEDEMRGYTKHRNPVDSLLRKLSQFLWHAFYLWDVNRYLMYYKLLFFDWLKIDMYKRLDQ